MTQAHTNHRFALMRVLSACAALTPLSSSPALANGWSDIATPTRETSRPIGQTTNGCVAGAVPLALEGEGYLVMHLERNRYFGHPNLIRSIQTLGQQAAQRGIGKLQIGDLSQPRGGPMPFGHHSHQTGLDADIWFNLDPKVYTRADALRANINAPSMLYPTMQGLDRNVWSRRHEELLELAAHLPEVERIFVNPYIKRALCGKAGGNRNWLRKIRPWHSHHDHFHMRLACPAGSPDCERQEAIPPGDGCDASLAWWFEPHPPAPPPAPKPPMPEQCRAILGKP